LWRSENNGKFNKNNMKSILILAQLITLYFFSYSFEINSLSLKVDERVTSPFPIRCTDVKQKITMSLEKYTYKEYEPVLAKFEVINYDSIHFKIYDMFIQYSNISGTIIEISDTIGNKWSMNLSPGDQINIGGPTYILKFNDTLIVSMPINNWGEKYKGWSIFGEFGYFPAGRKYKARFINNDLISNEVVFEVVKPNEDDEKVIQLYKDIFGKITEDGAVTIALSKYPANEYTMHLRAINLPMKYYKYKKTGIEKEILKDYRDFFEKFPNSFYLYSEQFMAPLYNEICSEKKDFDDILLDVKDFCNTFEEKLYFENNNLKIQLKNLYNKLHQ
jgi:hypothetical protein